MFTKHHFLATVFCTAILSVLVAGCATPTPEVIEVLSTVVVTPTLAKETITPGSTPEVLPTTSVPPMPTLETPTVAPASPAQLPTLVPVDPPYDDRGDPVRLLASYYNAINRREYERAWGYWENPPNPSYKDFVQGYAETASVLLVVRPPTRFEGAAGSVYVGVPTLLIATHFDGSQHNFVGCYVARRANPDIEGAPTDRGWSLYRAMITATPGNTADATLLAQACATQ